MTVTDFVLEAPNTDARLLVEAKSTTAPDNDWLARLVRNLVVHSYPRSNEIFLLALRNYFYVWKHLDAENLTKPDTVARTEDVLAPYLAGIHASLEQINPTTFEMLVRTWLTDLATGNLEPTASAWLREAGLEQFQRGTIKTEEKE
jgi:hypothetical protein